MSQDTDPDAENPLLICKLVAHNFRTMEIWRRPENSSRYGPPSYRGIQGQRRSNRESSLSDDDSDADPDEEPELNLTFDMMPKDVSQGFVFGSDRKVCDIYCGEPDDSYRICSRIFSITISDGGHVVLNHMTQKTITSVQYGEQSPGTRRTFTWILFPGSEPLFVTAAKKLQFEVRLPDHRQHRLAYQENVERYLKARRDAIPPVGQMGLETRLTSTQPSSAITPNTRRFYYKVPNSELGRGTFGRVFMVRDVSNGNRYAAKEFFRNFDWHEITMLSALSHQHIVSYIEHTEEDSPMLIMEYMEGGDLRKQIRQRLFDPAESITLLHQMLLAIRYMHGQARRVVHRDIKPENILFQKRNPMHAKLGDFGSSWNGTVVKGFKGTPEYCAPEVYSHQSYDKPVDIWSLGVVILELVWPTVISEFKGRKQGSEWCRYLAHRMESGCRVPTVPRNADEAERYTILLFLTKHMLKIEPKERSTASGCLVAAMSQDFRFWTLNVQGLPNPTNQIGSILPVPRPLTKESVEDESDLSTPRADSHNSRAIAEKAGQSKVQGRLFDAPPLHLSNRKDTQGNAEGRRPRRIIFRGAQFETSAPDFGQNPDEPSHHEVNKAKYVSRLAPYRYDPDANSEEDRPPPEDENPKRVKLAPQSIVQGPPPALPPPQGPRKARSKSRMQSAEPRVTRERAKRGNHELLKGLD